MDQANNITGVEVAETAASPEPVSVPSASPVQLEPLDAWKKVRELALKQLDRFMSLEPKVLRGDDPDAIHDIRVASRRLQQILDLLYPQPRPREIRRLRRRLRRSRRALGKVRNCDVEVQRVARVLASKRTARRESWEAVQHYLRQRRSQSFEKATRKLSKVNLAVFYVRLKEHLVLNGAASGADRAGHHLDFVEDLGAEQFYQRVGQALERVWEGFEAQVAQSHQDRRMPVIHGARIAAKRLRYLIEVIHAFDVSGSAEALAWLRGLQQLLGNWHDLEVLEQMMVEMVARPEFLRERLNLAMGVAKLIQRVRATKKGYEEKYLRTTVDAASPQKMKEWVRELLASPAAAFVRT